MTEGCARAAAEHGGRRALERRRRRPADCVDATVDAVEAALADAVVDCDVVQATRDELVAGDVPVLPRGDAGDFFVSSFVISACLGVWRLAVGFGFR